MPYTPLEWKDGPEGGTPISAANLNRMEQGIKALMDAAFSYSFVGSSGFIVDDRNPPNPFIDVDGVELQFSVGAQSVILILARTEAFAYTSPGGDVARGAVRLTLNDNPIPNTELQMGYDFLKNADSSGGRAIVVNNLIIPAVITVDPGQHSIKMQFRNDNSHPGSQFEILRHRTTINVIGLHTAS